MKKLVEVKILSGSRSIGGNFVRIKDGDRTLIFDQGIRFDIMSNYYSTFITPRGTSELRDLGILPKAEWYEDASGIYISHMHLDHLGALSNIPFEVKAHLPNLPIYEDMEEKWKRSPTWLSLVPRKYYVELEELKPIEADKNDVMAIPIPHSAYPAYALLYFGKGETVLYSGDFRVESFLSQDEFFELKGGQDLLNFLGENRDIRVDTLIIEGTNIGSSRLPVGPKEAIDIFRRIASSHKFVIATLHGLDLEYAFALMKLAADLDLSCHVASSRIARLLEKVMKPPLKPKLIEGYVNYLSPLRKITLEEISENTIIFVSYREVVDFLKDVSSASNFTKDWVAVMSEPEPEVEEASGYRLVANWLSKMRTQAYRVRASGHYYPYQLKTIMQIIKPKEVIPIHTLHPEYLHALSRKSCMRHKK